MGSAVGLWQLIDNRKQAKQQSAATNAQMLAQATETGKAEAKAEAAERDAKAGTAATATQLDTSKVLDLSKKKKGVQSTFVASSAGAGAGMAKGTTLTPIGS